jgi:hypothetical protein
MGLVTGFIDVIVEPMQEAARQIAQLSTIQKDANGHLQKQGLDLTTTFGGHGANAFLTMVQRQGSFIAGITHSMEETERIFTQTANTLKDAAHDADWALGGPLFDLAERVLAHLQPHIVIRNGESAVYAITSDMRRSFGKLVHHSGGFLSEALHGHFSSALHDAEHALGDLAHLGEDLFALLDQVEEILGRWAARAMEAMNWLVNQLERALFSVEDFVLGFSEIDTNAAIIADPNSTFEEKVLAGATIGITLLGDALLFIPGAQEGKALEEGGDIALREAEAAAEEQAAKLIEKQIEQQVEHRVEDFILQDGDKLLLSHLETMIIQDGENTFLQKLEVTLIRDGDKTLLYKAETRAELQVEEEVGPEVAKESAEQIAEEESKLEKFQRISNSVLKGDLITITPRVNETLNKSIKQVTDWATRHGLQLLYDEGKTQALLDGTGTKLLEKIVQEKTRDYLSEVIGGPVHEYLTGRIDEYELDKKINALTQSIVHA